MSPRQADALRGGDQSIRDHLIATAAALIEQRGTVDLTVRDIAREAHLASGVLYNHFANKEELLVLALHTHVRSAMRTLAHNPVPGQGTLEANLHSYITSGLQVLARILPVFTSVVTQPKIVEHFHLAAQGPGLPDQLAAYLSAEQRLGRLHPDASPDAAAAMIIGACHQLVLPRLFHSFNEELQIPPGFVDDLVATALTGLSPA
jgi:AcrR family transcriptional regulator